MHDVHLARGLASKAHAGQLYGTEPYMYHLDCVHHSVAEAAPNDERLHVIAYLHDILEDTSMPASVLHELFEDKVVDAVFALTKMPGMPYEDYITKVKANPLALIVKRHDALCNLTESLRRGDLRRVRKYASVLQQLSEG